VGLTDTIDGQQVAADDVVAPVGDRAMRFAENSVYTAVGLLLLVCACFALVSVGYDLVTQTDEGAIEAVTEALDGLLLVFIVIELFGAVRQTLAERNLFAEPFLVVGIIASIKEIVVTALEVGDVDGEDFEEAMTEIAVLGGVVLVLAIASFLVRRKEREPAEQ
jgi:uncharacterized membrane protein (DUF373 family)